MGELLLTTSTVINIMKMYKYIKKVETMWQRDERKILSELSKITSLKWSDKKIYCYVVKDSIPFSDPLTIPIYKKYPDYFIDVLIHELIHRLFTESMNLNKSKKAWNYIFKKYKKQPYNTKIHIPLHAIHAYIFLKFYNKRRLKREIDWISYLSDYKKSWQIVQKEGYKNIIREFVKLIK